MTPGKVRGIAYRLTADERIDFARADLETSSSEDIQNLAIADWDGDGWVTPEEMQSGRQGLYASAHRVYQQMTNEVRHQELGTLSIAGLRQRLAAGETVVPPPLPAPLGAPGDDLSHLARKAFVPLAEHMAARLAAGGSYEAWSTPGADIVHTDITDAWQGRSEHELFAAISIMAAREGGVELALCRDEKGRVHLLRGMPDAVELDGEIVGLDLLVHSHPLAGEHGARPSHGDLHTARDADPNQTGAVVSEDGWFASYRMGKDSIAHADEPRRLWS